MTNMGIDHLSLCWFVFGSLDWKVRLSSCSGKLYCRIKVAVVGLVPSLP